MEVKHICQQIKMEDIKKFEFPKKEMQAAIFEAHYKSMLSHFEASKKLEDIKNDNFSQMQDYFKDKKHS